VLGAKIEDAFVVSKKCGCAGFCFRHVVVLLRSRLRRDRIPIKAGRSNASKGANNMSPRFPEHGWLAALRRVFPGLARRRHYASTNQPSAAAQKLEPIAKIVADAGRNSTTPAD
jgi:hypothetical protein